MPETANTFKLRIEEAEIPLRELGALSGLNYQRICDWKKGWVELKEMELAALKAALTTAIQARVGKFNQMLKQSGDNGE